MDSITCDGNAGNRERVNFRSRSEVLDAPHPSDQNAYELQPLSAFRGVAFALPIEILLALLCVGSWILFRHIR